MSIMDLSLQVIVPRANTATSPLVLREAGGRAERAQHFFVKVAMFRRGARRVIGVLTVRLEGLR